MRLLRTVSLSSALLLFFSYATTGQTIVPDTKLMGLKGQVKSLVRTSKSISGYAEWVLKDKTIHQTTYLFDREGNITETVYEGSSKTKTLYSKIAGYKTFKTIELEPRKNQGRFTVLGGKEPEPIEPEKLTVPDKRFDLKYVYETDSRGRVVSERQYWNNGKLHRKRTFEYGPSGDYLIKEIEMDSVAIMTYTFKYDDVGTLIEVNKTRDIRGAGSDSTERILYTDFKFDSVGNWTERTITTYSKTDAMPQYNVPTQTYTFVNVESRTLTYY